MNFNRVLMVLYLAGFFPLMEIQAEPVLPPVFSVHDRNLDGYIDRQEYAALLARLRERALKHQPRHGPIRRPPDFDSIDHNHDARISQEEMVMALERRHRHRYRGGRNDESR
jgi:Ca2+-binding EF-hand superfamily protein